MIGFFVGLVVGGLITLYFARSDFRQKVNSSVLGLIDKLAKSMNKPPEKAKGKRTKRIVKTPRVQIK